MTEQLSTPQITRAALSPVLWENWRRFAHGEFFFTRHGNVDPAEQFDTARLKILVCFLSPGPVRSYSSTYAALATMKNRVSPDDIFMDLAFFPDREDYKLQRELGIPPWFGVSSHAPVQDFDFLFVSHSVIPEFLNHPYALHHCGIPLAYEERMARPDLPFVLYGGMAASTGHVLMGDPCMVDAALFGQVDGILEPLLRETLAGPPVKANKPAYQRWAQTEFSERAYWFNPTAYRYHYEPNRLTLREIERLDPTAPELVKYGRKSLSSYTNFERKLINLDGSNAESADCLISHGCQGIGCSFCSEGVVGGQWRQQPLDKLAEDLQKIKANSAANTVAFTCVAKGTRIRTPEGTFPIESQVGASTGPVATEFGFKEYQKVVASGRKPVFRVTTARGYQIRASADHLFKLYDRDWEVSWSRLGDLEVGQYLTLSLRKQDIPGFDPDFYLAGLWYGDGTQPSAYNRTILIAKQEPELKKLALECMTGEQRGIYDTKRGVERICLSSALTQRLTAILPGANDGQPADSAVWRKGAFLSKFGGKLDRIPETIWQSSLAQKASFVRGLFDSDGHCSPPIGIPTFSSVKLGFIQDLQGLMLEMGIATAQGRYRQAGFPSDNEYCYVLRVSGRESFRRFRECIGFRVDKKRLMMESRVAASSGKGKDGDPIPFSGKRLREALGDINCRSRLYGNTRPEKQFTSRDTVLGMASQMQDQDFAQRACHIAESVLFDRIVSIEPDGEEETYDVIRTETGDFLANGFVTHNSLNGNYFDPYLDLLKLAGNNFKNLSLINMRADVIAAAPEHIELAKRLGLVRISMAIEGMGDRVRNNVLNKNLYWEQIREACRNVLRHKFLMIKFGLILTGQETEEDVQRWIWEMQQIVAMRDEVGAKTIFQVNHTNLVHYNDTPLRWLPREGARWSWEGSRTFTDYIDAMKALGVRTKFNGRGVGTFIEQFFMDTGRACTDVAVHLSIQEEMLFFRTFIHGEKEKLERVFAQFGVDPTMIFPGRDARELFPCDVTEFVTPQRLERWKQLHASRNYYEEYCLRNLAKPKTKCRSCGFCEGAQEILSIIKRPIGGEISSTTVDDVIGSLAAQRHVSTTRVVIRRDPVWSMVDCKALKHLVAAQFLQRSESLTQAYYAVGQSSLDTAGEQGQKAWFSGRMAFDVQWKRMVGQEELTALLPAVNEALEVCQVESLEELPKEAGFAQNSQVLYFGHYTGYSMAKLQRRLETFDWQVRYAKRRRGIEVELGLRHLPELRHQILAHPSADGLWLWLALPMTLNPYLVLSSIVRTQVATALLRAEFEVVDHVVPVDAPCDCGRESLMYSYYSGKVTSHGPKCIGKQRLLTSLRSD